MNENLQELQDDILIKYFEGATILITGATGFLGQNLVKFFMDFNESVEKNRRCKIIALCRNQKKISQIFKDYLFLEHFVVCRQDMIEPISIQDKVDYIIHTASPSNTSYIQENPVEVIQANVMGTNQLLKFAKEKVIRSLLFFSSGAIYGNTKDATQMIKEEESYPLEWNGHQSSYAISKIAGESLCYAYYREYGVPCKIVRLSHTYGPGIDLDDGHIYSDFTKAMLEKRDLVLNGNGHAKRAFCYITDAIRGILLILVKGKQGEAYNLANVKEHFSIKDLAKKLAREVYPEYGIQVVCSNKYIEDEENMDYPTDCSKLIELGWEPVVDVVSGFRNTVESFKEKEEGLE